MKKFLSIIFILMCTTFCFSQNVNLFPEEIDSDLMEFVEDLNSQSYQEEAEYISKIINKLAELKPSNQTIDFSIYTNRMTPTDTPEFLSLSLSEKLKVFRENSRVESEMISAFMSVVPSTKNSPEYIEQSNLIKDLLFHTSRLMDITSNIISASNDYVGVAINNLTDAIEYIDDAKIKMALLTTQISFLNETIAYQEVKNKRAYITGNVIMPIIGIAGLVPSVYLITKGDELGYDLMMIDLGLTLGCELIWNGGHIIFKWW